MHRRIGMHDSNSSLAGLFALVGGHFQSFLNVYELHLLLVPVALQIAHLTQ